MRHSPWQEGCWQENCVCAAPGGFMGVPNPWDRHHYMAILNGNITWYNSNHPWNPQTLLISYGLRAAPSVFTMGQLSLPYNNSIHCHVLKANKNFKAHLWAKNRCLPFTIGKSKTIVFFVQRVGFWWGNMPSQISSERFHDVSVSVSFQMLRGLILSVGTSRYFSSMIWWPQNGAHRLPHFWRLRPFLGRISDGLGRFAQNTHIWISPAFEDSFSV